MIVKCIFEPRGDIGLEGFQLNETYKLIEKSGYYYLYPWSNGYLNSNWIDRTTKKRKFWKYFTEVVRG